MREEDLTGTCLYPGGMGHDELETSSGLLRIGPLRPPLPRIDTGACSGPPVITDRGSECSAARQRPSPTAPPGCTS
jgi:hypothetical protein